MGFCYVFLLECSEVLVVQRQLLIPVETYNANKASLVRLVCVFLLVKLGSSGVRGSVSIPATTSNTVDNVAICAALASFVVRAVVSWSAPLEKEFVMVAVSTLLLSLSIVVHVVVSVSPVKSAPRGTAHSIVRKE